MQDGHVLVRRDHIDAVRPDLGAILDLDDFHAGGALEQFGHDALVRRVQVLDDDKGHAAARRHVLQELLQGLQSPGGSADADDGEIEMGLFPPFGHWGLGSPGNIFFLRAEIGLLLAHHSASLLTSIKFYQCSDPHQSTARQHKATLFTPVFSPARSHDRPKAPKPPHPVAQGRWRETTPKPPRT